MTIVCATHFTDSSSSAVQAATALAKAHHDRLCLVSVVSGLADEQAQRSVTDVLRSEAAALTSAGVDTETAVRHGPLARSVRQLCTDKEASLVVVGGSSQTETSLFGNQVDALASEVDLPLLVIRDAKPFEAWAHGHTALKVMLALDHTWSSAAARAWINRLAEYGAIDLVTTFLWWPSDEYRRRNLQAVPGDDSHSAIEELVNAELSRALFGLPANVTARIRLEIGSDHLSKRLVEMAQEEQVDLLVLGSHPVTGPIARNRSVTHGVLTDAPMSVACIPQPLPPPAQSEQIALPSHQQAGPPTAVS